jgi:hypothetical protein
MITQKLLSYIIPVGLGLATLMTDTTLDSIYRYEPITPENLRTVEYHPKPLNENDITRLKKLSKKDYDKVVKGISTPEEAMFYIMTNIQHTGINIDSVLYGENDYWASFKHIHENKKDDCDGGALTGAALLNDDNYPAYVLRMFKGEEGHMVFLFEDNNKKFYSLGYNPGDNILTGRNSIEELVKDIMNGPDWQYTIINMAKKHPNFINNDINNRDM